MRVLSEKPCYFDRQFVFILQRANQPPYRNMFNYRLLTGISAAVFLVLTIFILRPEGQAEKADMAEMPTEKSKRMDDFSHPDQFLAYHAAIRTAENGPVYPGNYRMDAFTKAVAARKTPGRKLEWVERGPANVPGRTRALIVDPDDPFHQTWFVGSVGGGLWKTSDGGQSWQVLTDHLPNLSVSALAMADSDRDVIYMGTGEGFGNIDGIIGSGIFKTTDRGNTWMQLSSTTQGLDFLFVNRLAVDPGDANTVVAATNIGIYRSSDGGSSWDNVYVHADTSRVQDLRARPDDFNTQFATVRGSAVLRSTDGGRTWEVSFDDFVSDVRRMELAIAPSNPTVVYMSAESGSGADLYRTSDGGESWSPVFESGSAAPNWLGGQGWYDQSLAVHPFDADHVFLGGIDLWETTILPGTKEVRFLSDFEETNTSSFLDFVAFTSGNYFGGRLQTGDADDEIVNVTPEDFVSVEIRFGPGRSQKAHRFAVSPTGGAAGDGGAGVAFAHYQYRNYADVPFEVWDIDNSRQLMVSFRDQADDGVYDLKPDVTEGNRDDQSREYLFIHGYEYSGTEPNERIAQNGGLINKILYFMWPILAEDGMWDGSNLPESVLRITAKSGTGLLRQTSQHPASGSIHVDHHNIHVIPIDETENLFSILNANDGGVYFSEDSGARFNPAGKGLNTTQFYGVDKRPGFNVYIAGSQDNGTWRSFNNPHSGQGWLQGTPGDGFETVWHSEDENYMLASSQFNRVWRSTSGGRQFDEVEGPSDTGPFITVFGNSKDWPDRVFMVGSVGVWRSVDFGATWTVVPLSPEAWDGRGNGKVEVALANPSEVWAGYRHDNQGPRTGMVHVSTDGGYTFNPVSVPDMAPEASISGIATHPNVDSTAYLLYSIYSMPKILRTTDLGQTWTDLSGFESGSPTSTNGFPNVAVYDLFVMPAMPNVIWAGTEIGIFVSEDDGESWEYSNSGMPAASIWQMRNVDNQLILATHGRGIWTLDLDTENVIEDVASDVPASFQLQQNYPNPFNASTTITFDAPQASRIKIQVYDLAGRLVTTLTDRAYQSGTHEVDWDAIRHASGVYHYRLEAEGVVRTKSMTLVK